MGNPTAEVLVTLGRWYVRNAPGTFAKAPLAGRFLNPRLRDEPRRRVAETAIGARFAVIIGEDEIARNVVQLRDLKQSSQSEVAMPGAARAISQANTGAGARAE